MSEKKNRETENIMFGNTATQLSLPPETQKSSLRGNVTDEIKIIGYACRIQVFVAS